MFKSTLVVMLSLLLTSMTSLAANPFEKSSSNPFEQGSGNPFDAIKVSKFEGNFVSDSVLMVINTDGKGLSGKITLVSQNKTYKFTGTEKKNKLSGKFNSGGQLFPFSFSLAKNAKSGIFKTGSFESKLNKASAGSVASKSTSSRSSSSSSVNMTSDARSEFQQAYDMIRQEYNNQQRNTGLSVFISIIAKAGEFDWAKQIADGLSNETASRDLAYQFIAAELARQGRKADAMDYQGRIRKDFMRDSFKTSLARGLAEAGDYNGAMQIAQSASEALHRASGLGAIADTANRNGDKSQAQSILSRAIASADGDGAKSGLVYAIARIQGPQQAIDVMRSIEKPMSRMTGAQSVAQEMYERNSMSAKSALLNIIDQSIDDANQYEKPSIQMYKVTALAWLEGASAALNQLGSVSDSMREYARSSIATAIAGRGDFSMARSIANDISNTGVRDSALSSIVGQALEKKDFNMAERLIQDISSQSTRGYTMANLTLYRLKG